MNKPIQVLLCLIFLVLSGDANSQNVKRWSLQECIEYAIAHNFQLAQNTLTVEQSEISLLQSKAVALPSLNGSANHTYNFGRRIDPFTNQFANKKVLSQNFSLSSNLNLFGGLSNTQTILSNQLAVIAAKYTNDQLINDISLQVTNSFLQIILADELLSIADNQLRLTREQSERGKLLYEAGRTARGDFLQAEAQLANEELNVINARNRLELAKLTLAQLLSLESAEEFDIVKPNFDQLEINLPPYNAKDLFTVAVERQPGILGAEYRLKSSERGLKAARGGYYPSLSVFGGIGTGYSELSRSVIGSTTQQQNFGSFQGQPIVIDVEVPIYEKTPFRDQMDQNFNRTVGFSLSVPIFNGLRTRSQVSQQKIAVENARLQHSIVKNQLRRDIQTAWFDARSSFERYQATAKSVKALEEAFNYIQQRYDVGMVNALEFNTSKNQLISARSNLAQARYEFILRVKVLDFYQGKPISF
jgi:outer membrane protein